MTKKLAHVLDEGQNLVVKLDGATDTDYTVPDGKVLKITAREVRYVPGGTRIEVLVDGVKRLDHTVPANQIVIVETELWEAEPE